MRTISTYAGSSPSYHFTITDYLSAGVDVDSMSIGMVVYTDTAKTYIVPQRDFSSLDVSNYLYFSSGSTVIKSDHLCKYLGSGKFSVTIPCTSELIGDYSYEVFLFKYSVLEYPATNSSDTTDSGLALLTMIVIDDGSISFNESALPVNMPVSNDYVSREVSLESSVNTAATSDWNLETL